MRALLACLLLVLGAGWARASEAPPEGPSPEALARAQEIEESLVRAVERVRLSSVSVFQYRTGRDGGLHLAGCGSGVLVERRNRLWVLTNVHVIAGNQELRVVLHDGSEHRVFEHDSIPSYDIALLRFEERPRGVRGVAVKASTSARKLSEGTWVIATGNPFFLATEGRSVTTLGVISGLDRYLGGEYQYVGAIQHDAEVNPGNSGGPLWNLDGDLAGINGKIAMGYRFPGAQPSYTGAAFALPVHQVDEFLDLLIKDQNAQAGFLGIDCETATDARGNPMGARVSAVDRRSPVTGSRDAPVKDDVITSVWIKGSLRRVYTSIDLRREISLYPAGTTLKLKFRRGTRWLTWSGALGVEAR